MTPVGKLHGAAPPGWVARLGYVATNLSSWIAGLGRPPRAYAEQTIVPAWRRYGFHLVAVGVVALVLMIWIDKPAILAARELPFVVFRVFDEVTDFGRSGWFLIPVGVLIALVAVADRPGLARSTHLALAAIVARLGFMFVAVGLPSLAATVLKRIIGRVRPSDFGPFAYEPFSWRAAYASMPSGHATTVFAILVAVGALYPRLRWLCWGYAIVIGISRVVVTAHYPSDVVLGAAFGAFGALLVRDWFAVRNLAFYVGPDGSPRAMSGPSWARLKGVARRLFAS